jgi:uncharacterized protein YqgC (DUF456 family)
MEIALIIIGIIFILIGIAGSILPGLPGPPIAYLSLLVLFLHESASTSFADNNYLWLISFGVITIFITVVDYYMPIWGTKKYGGTRAGSRGSTIGLILGVVLTFAIPGVGAIALLLGPAVGAYVGEKNAGQNNQVAVQSAKGSFLGFMAGTFMKFVVVISIGIYFTRLIL